MFTLRPFMWSYKWCGVNRPNKKGRQCLGLFKPLVLNSRSSVVRNSSTIHRWHTVRCCSRLSSSCHLPELSFSRKSRTSSLGPGSCGPFEGRPPSSPSSSNAADDTGSQSGKQQQVRRNRAGRVRTVLSEKQAWKNNECRKYEKKTTPFFIIV